MKTLTKAHLAARDALCVRLVQSYCALGAALQLTTDTLATAWETVNTALDAHNAIVGEANDWREDIASQIQNTIDDHGDQWQESMRGQAYAEWVDAWENGTLDTIELEAPEMPELDIDDQSTALGGLPEEP